MCEPILVTLLKMRPQYSQYSRENATPSSGATPQASYKDVHLPGLRIQIHVKIRVVYFLFFQSSHFQ